MKIKSIKAESFGKLKDASFEFSPKINIVCGENESGKSSVGRFVRFMLYGFTSRGSEISNNDKKKYMPWDESVCKGQMEIERTDGDSFSVRREQGQKGHSLIADKDGTPVFTDKSAGEVFFGVDADTFDRTALISAGDVAFEDTEALAGAVKNMVFSADSTVDSDKALKILENYKKSILSKNKKSGRLAEARLEREELISRQREVRELHKELLGAQSNLEKTRASIDQNAEKLKKLAEERANLESLRAYELTKKIDDAKCRVDESRSEYEKKSIEMTFDSFIPDRAYLSAMNDTALALGKADTLLESAKSELAAASEALRTSFRDADQLKFNGLLDDSGKKPKDILDDIALLKKEQKSAKKTAIILTFLIITLPIAAFFYVKSSKIKKKLAELYSAFECEDLQTLEKRLSEYDASSSAADSAKQRCKAAKDALVIAENARMKCAGELADMLDKTGCGVSISDTSALMDTALRHVKKLDSDVSDLELKKNALSSADAIYNGILASVPDVDELREKAAKYDPDIPIRDESKIKMEYDFCTSANSILADKEREYEKKAAVLAGNMEKPDELAARINLLSEEISRLELNYDALDLASGSIELAHERMRGNFSPRLTSRASELFKEITGGKYEGLFVDKDFGLTFLETGSSTPRSVEYLSSGALDAAYLSLRIALADMLYDETPVLVFDDAFVRFDRPRLEKICGVLLKISEKYQIIVLSCRDTESEILKDKANVIRI